MGRILIPGGGGADLDVVTATAKDVRLNKVIVDKDGNPLTGTMAEKGAATYTPNRSNQTIAANQYLTGAQTIKGDTNLLAANIKKGVSIFGVVGTWDGYVITAEDWYNRGSNPIGFTVTTGTMESNAIYSAGVSGGSSNQRIVLNLANKNLALVNYNKLNIYFQYNGNVVGYGASATLLVTTPTGTTQTFNAINGDVKVSGRYYTISISINAGITLRSATLTLQYYKTAVSSQNAFVISRIYTS